MTHATTLEDISGNTFQKLIEELVKESFKSHRGRAAHD